MRIPFLAALAVAAIPLGTTATLAVSGPLKDVAYVSEGLIAAGMAIELDAKCDEVSVRIFRGIGFLNGLKTHARELGYSEAEIETYINDAPEKARLEAIARARLAALGVVTTDPASYCRVGQAEIAAGTAVGQLLR